MSTKEVDKSTYIWSHIAVIVFHSLIGIILISSYYNTTIKGIQTTKILLYVGWFLLILSLLSLVPILKNHDKIVIE